MASRKFRVSKQCFHPGCDHSAIWEFDSRKAYLNSHEFRLYEKGHAPYFCAKHSRGNGVLSASNLFAEWISEPSRPMEKYPEDPYLSFGSQGIIFGPGFAAEGCDFPTGTRIKVTAEVLLPETDHV